MQERAFATFMMFVLLAVMFILVLANGRMVANLQKEMKLIEQQQLQRLNVQSPRDPTKPRQLN